jgi:hypothetical protein
MEDIMANPFQSDLEWYRHLARMDYNSELISAREEGFKIGLEEGKTLVDRRTAKAMKEKHFSPEDISDITGLSLSEIAAL